ncbi:MAG: glycerol-3-phosphate 1-O-acyltransferase PlsY [Chloroflexota bacterium]|nr:glycerol-3-phosphate 1-O-acyltransferase PlsY [Chloroflexota bacterium]
MIVTQPGAIVLSAVAGYLIGSIPVGYLIGRSQGVDVRSHGSGKMGATNVLRTLGPKASAAVMVCDIGKGVLAVGLVLLTGHGIEAEVAAGVAAILGHIFPVFVGFRGGRGVATSLGALLMISPAVGVAALLIGLAVIARSRLASLGFLVGGALALVLTLGLFLNRLETLFPVVYCLIAFLIVAAAHRDNIQRLAAGTERKIQL